MGDRLWISASTGYRRRGTRLAEFRAVLGAGITARAVLEPLESCPSGANSEEMARHLREKHFDVAGVQDRPDGPVYAFVEERGLKSGSVREHQQELRAEHLVSDATPLPDLLTRLLTRPRAFVLEGTEVRGIVTRADLNKPPVRTYLFGLVSLLEMHLEYWIRAEYPEESWAGYLEPKRIKKAKGLQRQRSGRGQECTLLECLQLCDKGNLIVQKAGLRSMMKLGGPKEAGDFLAKAESLRNGLAHSSHDLVSGSSWPEVLSLVRKLELAIESSDATLEAQRGGLA